MNNKDLINKIIEASDAISKASRRGQGNYIVTNQYYHLIPTLKMRIDKIERIKNKLKI